MLFFIAHTYYTIIIKTVAVTVNTANITTLLLFIIIKNSISDKGNGILQKRLPQMMRMMQIVNIYPSAIFQFVIIFLISQKSHPPSPTPSSALSERDFVRHRGTGRSAPRNKASGTEEPCLPRCRTKGSVTGEIGCKKIVKEYRTYFGEYVITSIYFLPAQYTPPKMHNVPTNATAVSRSPSRKAEPIIVKSGFK